jgi:divalent metal cation (Fe/Co/Zn/Cd) transporter
VVDTVVHVEPLGADSPRGPWESLALKLRGRADGLGIAMHDLHAHVEREGGYALEAHVEVDSSLTLGAAHALVDEFERRVLAEVPEVQSFVTHLEPLPAELADEAGHVARMADLRTRVVALVDGIAGRGSAHQVVVHNVAGHLTVTLDVTQPASLPLVEAHALAEKIERALHSHEHRLRRVVVHVEPPE